MLRSPRKPVITCRNEEVEFAAPRQADVIEATANVAQRYRRVLMHGVTFRAKCLVLRFYGSDAILSARAIVRFVPSHLVKRKKPTYRKRKIYGNSKTISRLIC